MSQMYEMTITATGEIRDAEGNLIETVPISSTTTITAEQAAELGYPVEGEKQ